MAKCKETLAITNHRVISEDINEHETVYGGRILEILDGTASTSAARLARTQTVTAAIDDVNFIAPFALHDSFCVESYVTGVGTHSIEVFAKVVGEHLLTGERFLGMTAFSLSSSWTKVSNQSRSSLKATRKKCFAKDMSSAENAKRPL